MPISDSKHLLNDQRLIKFAGPLFILLCTLILTACPKENPSGPRVGMSESPREATPGMVPGAVAFNGERAMEHVKKQMEMGPRVPGSTELAVTRDYIIKSMRDSGLVVKTDEFNATTPIGEKKMVNITGEIRGRVEGRDHHLQPLRLKVFQGHAFRWRERSGKFRGYVVGNRESVGREPAETEADLLADFLRW